MNNKFLKIVPLAILGLVSDGNAGIFDKFMEDLQSNLQKSEACRNIGKRLPSKKTITLPAEQKLYQGPDLICPSVGTVHGQPSVSVTRETDGWYYVSVFTSNFTVTKAWVPKPGVAQVAPPAPLPPKPAYAKQDVLEAQNLLNELGYDAGVADGLYGGRTASAIEKFQKDNQIPPSGKLDANTMAALKNAENHKVADTPPLDSIPLEEPKSVIPSDIADDADSHVIFPVQGKTVAYSRTFFDEEYVNEVSPHAQHLGIDIPAEVGTQVVSPVKGTVLGNLTAAGDPTLRYMVIRDSQSGVEHVLGYITSPLVPGDTVAQGDVVGSVAEMHNGTVSRLHWGSNNKGVLNALGSGWTWVHAPEDATVSQAEQRGWIDPTSLVREMVTSPGATATVDNQQATEQGGMKAPTKDDIKTIVTALPYAELSAFVYDCNDICSEFDGKAGKWLPLIDSKETFRSQMNMPTNVESSVKTTTPAMNVRDEPMGFHAAAFRNSETNEIAIIYEGTSKLYDAADWATNLGNAFWTPSQYTNAVKFAEDVGTRFCWGNSSCTSKITLAGHSLGGGLAQYAAIKLGRKAFIFNPAGLWEFSTDGDVDQSVADRAEIIQIRSIGFRYGYRIGRDYVPDLGKHFSERIIDVPIELPIWAWDSITLSGVTHNMVRLRDHMFVMAGDSEADKDLAKDKVRSAEKQTDAAEQFQYPFREAPRPLGETLTQVFNGKPCTIQYFNAGWDYPPRKWPNGQPNSFDWKGECESYPVGSANLFLYIDGVVVHPYSMGPDRFYVWGEKGEMTWNKQIRADYSIGQANLGWGALSVKLGVKGALDDENICNILNEKARLYFEKNATEEQKKKAAKGIRVEYQTEEVGTSVFFLPKGNVEAKLDSGEIHVERSYWNGFQWVLSEHKKELKQKEVEKKYANLKPKEQGPGVEVFRELKKLVEYSRSPKEGKEYEFSMLANVGGIPIKLHLLKESVELKDCLMNQETIWREQYMTDTVWTGYFQQPPEKQELYGYAMIFDLKDVDLEKTRKLDSKIVMKRGSEIHGYAFKREGWTSLSELKMFRDYSSTAYASGPFVGNVNRKPFDQDSLRSDSFHLGRAYPEDKKEIYEKFYKLIEECQ